MLGGLCPFPFRLGAIGVTDGVTAEEYSRMGADTVSAVVSSPFAVVTLDMTAPGTVLAYNGQNGVGLGAAPVVTSVAPGEATVTWELSYSNDYRNSYPLDLNSATVTVHGSVALIGTAEIGSPRAVTVRVHELGVGPVDAKLTLKVF